jgi:methionyl-tRNA formyltransferase
LDTLRRLKAGSLLPQEQDESGVTFAPLLKKEDGLIDWAQPATMIERQVRGFDPWPGAYSHISGKLLKIHRARVVAADTTGTPGEILRGDAEGLWVATGSGVLGLEDVQFENRKKLSAAEFLRGARVKPGDRLQ